jgi:PadR family transcriptional regulator PadR
MNETELRDLQEKLNHELRRGVVILAALSQLDEAEYGYSLQNRLSELGLGIDQGTLYPLLRRLEEQGLLESEWSVEESRPRRYYRLNETGRAMLQQLAVEWGGIVGVMDRLLAQAGVRGEQDGSD